MSRPIITITKRKVLDEAGHFRYYGASDSVGYQFTLDAVRKAKNGRTYKYLGVQTEKELAWFIYQNYGVGTYRVFSSVRGRRGAWTFWRGQITDEGYLFLEKSKDTKEINKLQKDLVKAEQDGDTESVELIKEDIDWERDAASKEVTGIRYGFYPYLRRSGRRGEFHAWEEPDEAYYNPQAQYEDNPQDYQAESHSFQ